MFLLYFSLLQVKAASVTGTVHVRTANILGTTQVQNLSFGPIKNNRNKKCTIKIAANNKITKESNNTHPITPKACSLKTPPTAGVFNLKGLAGTSVKIRLKPALSRGWRFDPMGKSSSDINQHSSKNIKAQFSDNGEATLIIGGEFTLYSKQHFNPNKQKHSPYTIEVIY